MHLLRFGKQHSWEGWRIFSLDWSALKVVCTVGQKVPSMLSWQWWRYASFCNELSDDCGKHYGSNWMEGCDMVEALTYCIVIYCFWKANYGKYWDRWGMYKLDLWRIRLSFYYSPSDSCPGLTFVDRRVGILHIDINLAEDVPQDFLWLAFCWMIVRSFACSALWAQCRVKVVCGGDVDTKGWFQNFTLLWANVLESDVQQQCSFQSVLWLVLQGARSHQDSKYFVPYAMRFLCHSRNTHDSSSVQCI
jgi:hypothetical protein